MTSCFLRFQWNRKYFSSAALRLRSRLLIAPRMVSMYLIRRCRYYRFIHVGLLLDWQFFLLYLLQSVCCSKYFAKTAILYISKLFISCIRLPRNIAEFLLQRKTFCKQRIPEPGCARKETVEIDILITKINGDR